jgi:hypothetical protein
MSKLNTIAKAKIQRKIEENNMPFICIYELIEILKVSNNCSFSEAANLLSLIIEENTHRIETLCYFRPKQDNGHKIFTAFRDYYLAVNYKFPQNSHFELLINILKKNTFNAESIGFLNDYGVECNVFAKLLAEEGVSVDLGGDIKPAALAANEFQPIGRVPNVDPVQQQEHITPVAEALKLVKMNRRHIIQQEAWRYCLTLRAAGANPVVHSIEDHMANWCRENNIVGDKGSFVSGKTLRNTVLGGVHWTVPNHSPEQALKALKELPELPEHPLPGA